MRYAGIIKNDITGDQGIQLTIFTQGCHKRCKGCHNPETHDFNSGKEFTQETLSSIITGLTANNIHRDLNIQGGEPLCDENLFLVQLIIQEVKKKVPNTKIYIWTGYIYEELLHRNNPRVKEILEDTYCLVDGPFIKEEKDLTLPMRGSRNQRIIYLQD